MIPRLIMTITTIKATNHPKIEHSLAVLQNFSELQSESRIHIPSKSGSPSVINSFVYVSDIAYQLKYVTIWYYLSFSRYHIKLEQILIIVCTSSYQISSGFVNKETYFITEKVYKVQSIITVAETDFILILVSNRMQTGMIQWCVLIV